MRGRRDQKATTVLSGLAFGNRLKSAAHGLGELRPLAGPTAPDLARRWRGQVEDEELIGTADDDLLGEERRGQQRGRRESNEDEGSANVHAPEDSRLHHGW